jgi:hypothetical protein
VRAITPLFEFLIRLLVFLRSMFVRLAKRLLIDVTRLLLLLCLVSLVFVPISSTSLLWLASPVCLVNIHVLWLLCLVSSKER